MSNEVLRVHDINPDGVRVALRWDAFVVGASIFVPCINTDLAVKQLTKITDNKAQQVTIKIRVENGCLGVRIWRIV
jgi:hypothetical protein